MNPIRLRQAAQDGSNVLPLQGNAEALKEPLSGGRRSVTRAAGKQGSKLFPCLQGLAVDELKTLLAGVCVCDLRTQIKHSPLSKEGPQPVVALSGGLAVGRWHPCRLGPSQPATWCTGCKTLNPELALRGARTGLLSARTHPGKGAGSGWQRGWAG